MIIIQPHPFSLQPRRISAVSVADRVAHERNEALGISTGYSVRFESVLPRHYASILFCTVGKVADHVMSHDVIVILFIRSVATETGSRTIGYFPYHSGRDSRERHKC